MMRFAGVFKWGAVSVRLSVCRYFALAIAIATVVVVFASAGSCLGAQIGVLATSENEGSIQGSFHDIAQLHDGSLAIVDRYNNRILRLIGDQLRIWVGEGGEVEPRVNGRDIGWLKSLTVLSDGSVAIPDEQNDRILKLTGSRLRVWIGEGGDIDPAMSSASTVSLSEPTAITELSNNSWAITQGNGKPAHSPHYDCIVKLADGSLTVLVDNDNRVPAGHFLIGGRSATLSWSTSTAALLDGSLAILDTLNQRVLKLNKDGRLSVWIGEGGSVRPINCGTSNHSFDGMVVLADGALAMTDLMNGCIVKVTGDRMSNWIGTSATVVTDIIKDTGPTKIAALQDGSLVIVDSIGHRLVLVSPDDRISELVAQGKEAAQANVVTRLSWIRSELEKLAVTKTTLETAGEVFDHLRTQPTSLFSLLPRDLDLDLQKYTADNETRRLRALLALRQLPCPLQTFHSAKRKLDQLG